MHPADQAATRLPVVYIPHGGGPWPFVDLGLPGPELDALASYLRQLSLLPKAPPRALLVVSAHWEAPAPTVMTATRPPIFYDYYGFPPESYATTWPAPGDPALAARTRELLDAAGWKTAADARRGFDHGTFVPLKVTYPEADIPTVQLSLKRGLDPATAIVEMTEMRGKFDSAIFPAFVETVGAYPVGSVVRLSSDRLALVVDQDPNDHRQPRVRTFYSAALRKMIQPEDIQLAHCFGRDSITGLADPDAYGIQDFAKLRLRLFTAASKAAG